MKEQVQRLEFVMKDEKEFERIDRKQILVSCNAKRVVFKKTIISGSTTIVLFYRFNRA